jgi:hypothetical protein
VTASTLPAPEAKETDQFTIEPGLGELLESAFEPNLTKHATAWVEQITARRIDNQLRLVLAALGYITSRDDSRVRKVETPPAPRSLKAEAAKP